MNTKICISTDKRKWQTSPLPGQIVLVSTINKEKAPNIAPKSWISMVAFQQAIIGFGCNLKHQTAKNILENKEFVINIPSEDLIENIWKTSTQSHNDAAKLQALGFTLIPANKVSPPRIQECKAHLECIYDSDKRYGNEIWIFGKIINASINPNALQGTTQQRHKHLNPIFYLEEKTYSTLKNPEKIN